MRSSLRVASRAYDYSSMLQATASDDTNDGSVTREWTASRHGGHPCRGQDPPVPGAECPHMRERRWRLGRLGSQDAPPDCR